MAGIAFRVWNAILDELEPGVDVSRQTRRRPRCRRRRGIEQRIERMPEEPAIDGEMEEILRRVRVHGVGIVDAAVPEIGRGIPLLPDALVDQIHDRVDGREAERVELADALHGDALGVREAQMHEPGHPTSARIAERESILFRPRCPRAHLTRDGRDEEMRRGAEEDLGGGGGEAEDRAGGGEGEAGTQGEAGGGEVHEVFDVVKVGGEGEEELGGEREEAGWMGHGSDVSRFHVSYSLIKRKPPIPLLPFLAPPIQHK